VGANSVSRQVDGDGRVPAQLSISHLDPYNFGVIPVGSSTYETFIVTNTGNYTASSIGSVFSINDPFQFRGSGYPGLGGDCTISLVPGATCRLVVKFSPTYPGYSFDHLELDYNNGAYATTETKEVSGTGVGPALITISETDTFSYGSRPIGSVTSHSFTITNSGSHKAINIKGLIQAPFEFSGGTFPGGTGSCPNDGTLDFGRSCTVSIDFKPVANATSLGEFKLTYQNGSSKQSVSRLVEGTGIDALPPVSPGNWSWQFIGILLAAKNIDSSQLSNTISFYTNSTCVNATSVETITGTSLTQYFIFRSDGRDDGRKNFYVKVTDKNGYESTCDYVANYTLDTINLAPTNKKMKTTLLNKWTQANWSTIHY